MTCDSGRNPLRLGRRMLQVGGGAGALLLLLAAPAAADTAAASASAASLTLVGGAVTTSGSAAASNGGDSPRVDAGATPALNVLGAQSLITAGVLIQRAVAFNDGRSAACAGLVGSGGSISIGDDGACIVNPGAGNVRISVAGLTTIRADAITSSCTATSAGVRTGSAKLVNAGIYASGIQTTGLAATPSVNYGVSVPGVANIGANMQTSGTGTLTVTALRVAVLGGVSLDVGTSICGPNVVTMPTPAIPAHGVPIAAGVAGIAWYLHRRGGSAGRSARGTA